MPQPAIPPEELVKIKSIQKNKTKGKPANSNSKPAAKKPVNKVKKPVVKKPRVTRKSLPQWWLRMSDSQRERYVQKRPKSRYAQYIKLSKKKKKNLKAANDSKKPIRITAKQAVEDARAALEAHPKDRAAVRDHLERMAENPKKIVDEVDDKMTEDNLRDQVEPDELKQHEEELEDAHKKGDVKKFSKLLKKTAVMAGLGIGGALLVGTGALPYAIIIGNLVKESHFAFKQFSDRIDSGEGTLSAACGAGGNLIKRMAGNAAVLASAVALHYGKNRSGKENDEKDDQKHDEYFDRQKKKQKQKSKPEPEPDASEEE